MPSTDPNGPFPPGTPTVTGQNITVSQFLRSPARVERAIDGLTRARFVADVILSSGPQATGGAVLYDRVAAGDGDYAFLADEAEAIVPGSEFPILADDEPDPRIAAIRKWGGAVKLTYEQVERDRRDVLRRKLTKLRNTVIRRVDSVAMAAITGDADLGTGAGTNWTDPVAGDPFGDIAAVKAEVDGLDLGYEIDTVILNPADAGALMARKDIRESFTNAGDTQLIRQGQLGVVMGVTFLVTNRVAAGSPLFVNRGVIGGISDETPLYSRVVNDERTESWYVMAGRRVVPYVTDPLAGFVLTGTQG